MHMYMCMHMCMYPYANYRTPNPLLHVHMLDHDLLYAAEAHLFRQPRVIAWSTNVRPLHSTSQ